MPYQPDTDEMDDPEEEDAEEVSTLMQDLDAYSESKEDGTATVQESTDVKIREATASVMIFSDQDYRKLVQKVVEK